MIWKSAAVSFAVVFLCLVTEGNSSGSRVEGRCWELHETEG